MYLYIIHVYIAYFPVGRPNSKFVITQLVEHWFLFPTTLILFK